MFIRNVRISFPSVFAPSSYDGSQEAKYSATFIVEKGSEAHRQIVAGIKDLIAQKWPKRKPANLKICLRDGSEKGHLDGFGEDVVFFNATNTARPLVLNRDKTPLVQEDGVLYAGCYVNAHIEFWAQDNQYGKRVNATLQGVQFRSEGPAFGGAPRVTADDFEDLDALEGASPRKAVATTVEEDDFDF